MKTELVKGQGWGVKVVASAFTVSLQHADLCLCCLRQPGSNIQPWGGLHNHSNKVASV